MKKTFIDAEIEITLLTVADTLLVEVSVNLESEGGDLGWDGF